MLRVLAGFSPALVLLLGAAPAALGGWMAREAKLALIDRPAIERTATARAEDACAMRVTAAADRAEQAERSRQRAAGAEALRIYREALAKSSLAADLQAQQASAEIARYEDELEAAGRRCPLNPDDLDFVFGPGGTP